MQNLKRRCNVPMLFSDDGSDAVTVSRCRGSERYNLVVLPARLISVLTAGPKLVYMIHSRFQSNLVYRPESEIFS